MAVTVTFGTVNRLTDIDAAIEVPITLSEAVKNLLASDFEVTGVDNVEVSLDTSTDLKLILQLPLNVEGTLMVDAVGSVVVSSSGNRDTLTSTPLSVVYNTLVPQVIRREQHGTYTPGEVYDVVFQFNTAVEFYDPRVLFSDPNATEQNFFVFSGAQLGTPEVHVYTGTGFPSLPLPDTLGNDWEFLFKPNASTPAADVLLLRYPDVLNSAVGASLVEVKEMVYYNPM